jgi:hypothetical protein
VLTSAVEDALSIEERAEPVRGGAGSTVGRHCKSRYLTRKEWWRWLTVLTDGACCEVEE